MSKTPKFDAALDKIFAELKPHTSVCTETGERFEITERDIEMCRLLRVPPPKTTWLARMRQLRSFMGGFDLYRRQLPDGRSVVTLYDPDSYAKFLPADDWYADSFDPLAFGQVIDPNAPFFDQWHRFSKIVPRPSLQQDAKSVNSDWCIYFLNLKDCYNCFASWNGENLTYTDQTGDSVHDSDLSLCQHCEWSYDSVLCKNSSRTFFSERCENCVDVSFCLSCRNCSDCFGCTNLRNKRFCFLNEQLTREEYKARFASIDLSDGHVVEEWRDRIRDEVWGKAYRNGQSIHKSENVSGDDIENSRDVSGITIYDSERAYGCMLTFGAKDCYLSMGGLEFERCYNDLISYKSYDNRMTSFCWSCIDVEYSELLTSCEHCFGCVGLKHKKFCVFNKQYTEEEYWPLVDALKTAMLERGEYGEFFPHELNPIAYNSSHAMAIFPMTEAEAKRLGMRWYSFAEEKRGDASSTDDIPYRLTDTTDEILNQKFRDPSNGRIFRFVKPELDFHREMNLALPRVHPSTRRYARAAAITMHLYKRACDSCGKKIETRIPPEHTAPVLCGTCYEQVVLGEKPVPTVTRG